jgi:uncharacterized protein YneF (UPF0154 family)
MWLGGFRPGKQHCLSTKCKADASPNARAVTIPRTDGGLRMIKKALLIILLTVIFTMLLVSTSSSAFAAPKKVKQQIAETPPATKAEKIKCLKVI